MKARDDVEARVPTAHRGIALPFKFPMHRCFFQSTTPPPNLPLSRSSLEKKFCCQLGKEKTWMVMTDAREDRGTEGKGGREKGANHV